MMQKVLKLVLLATALVTLARAIPLGLDLETMGEGEDEQQLMACEEEDPDCGYIAFKVFAKYFPNNKYVKNAIAENKKMMEDLKECEEEDEKCDELKAKAFAMLFPDGADEAEAEEGNDEEHGDEEHEEMLADLKECIDTDPICAHLTYEAYCGEERNKGQEECEKIAAANAKFEAAAAKCEEDGKTCKKVAKKAFAHFFPDAFPKKELSFCRKQNKDCSYLAFKAYAHYHPENEWVKATAAENAKMAAAVVDCEENDNACLELKAEAFEKIFPESRKAKKEEQGPAPEHTEEHAKLAAERDECFKRDPLCKHIVIQAFCEEEVNHDSRTCAKVERIDRKFNRMLKRCERLSPDDCPAIATEAACGFFKDAGLQC